MDSSIIINGHTIYAQKARYELAWNIEETPEILGYLAKQGNIIYGGDILDEQLEYTYSNWYYEEAIGLTKTENALRSLETALKYISRFIKLNGTKFYVVIVSKPSINELCLM